MFSVCLPVYRYNAVALTRELLRQRAERAARTGRDDFEVLLYDDASPDDADWGRTTLRALPGLRYTELPANLGRAAIRNRMVRDARGKYCIVLDADAAIPPDYLMRYANFVGQFAAEPEGEGKNFVVVGGRRYADGAPTDHRLHLHWWYGRERESCMEYSTDRAWLGFHSNNFLATRSLLLAYPFPETVDGYGHEDTLWGQQFTGTGVGLYHLINAVVHLGLEDNVTFLRKQHQAIRNLHRLKNETPHLRTRLIDFAERFPRLTGLARHLPEARLVRYLRGTNRPDLRALDLLKLNWWAQMTSPPYNTFIR